MLAVHQFQTAYLTGERLLESPTLRQCMAAWQLPLAVSGEFKLRHSF
jgi:hypothetical protein